MLTQPLPQTKKTLFLCGLMLLCLGTIYSLQRPQAQAIKEQGKTASIKELERELSLEQTNLELLKQIPTFGFDNLIADWTFLRFLQYFGDGEARERTGYQLSLDYFEVIIEHDPRFQDAYLFLSSSGSIYAGEPERTVNLINQGLESLSPEMPGGYYIWRYKATDELLFLGEPATAQASYEKAAEWARISSDPNSDRVAASSQRTADFLAENPDSRRAQVSAWAGILNNPLADDEARERAKNRIEELGGEIVETPDGGWKVSLPDQD